MLTFEVIWYLFVFSFFNVKSVFDSANSEFSFILLILCLENYFYFFSLLLLDVKYVIESANDEFFL